MRTLTAGKLITAPGRSPPYHCTLQTRDKGVTGVGGRHGGRSAIGYGVTAE